MSDVKLGLEDVVVAETELSRVDGQAGRLVLKTSRAALQLRAAAAARRRLLRLIGLQPDRAEQIFFAEQKPAPRVRSKVGQPPVLDHSSNRPLALPKEPGGLLGRS